MKKPRKLIKTYVGLVWVEIKEGVLLRREAIESISENTLNVRTVSGMNYSFENKKLFLAFLKKLGINE